MVTPARWAERSRRLYAEVSKNSWVMAKSAPARCFAARTSRSSSGPLDSGWPDGYAATPRDSLPPQKRAALRFSSCRTRVTRASACGRWFSGGRVCPAARSPRTARKPRTPASMNCSTHSSSSTVGAAVHARCAKGRSRVVAESSRTKSAVPCTQPDFAEDVIAT